jgi:hypothetical protein
MMPLISIEGGSAHTPSVLRVCCPLEPSVFFLERGAYDTHYNPIFPYRITTKGCRS